MKKNILTLCIVLVCSHAFAQIIDFPDANFKNKLLSSQSGVAIAYACTGSSFAIDVNGDGEIEVSEALLVCSLFVDDASITDLTGLEYFTNLRRFKANNNAIITADMTPFSDMTGIDIMDNQLTSVNISGLTNLFNINFSNNQLTSLDMSGLSRLFVAGLENNQITSLDFDGTTDLHRLKLKNNVLTTLDVTNLTELTNLDVSSNNLATLYLQNGVDEVLLFDDNPDLEYICADATQLIDVNEKISQYGFTNCHTNSLCSFTPGGDTYTITGNIKYDEQQDGCDASDMEYPSLRLTVSDGTNSGDVYADVAGDYQYTVQAGDYSLVPQLENPAIFIITPSDVMVSFPAQTSPHVEDFCVTPNGVHPDLEMILTPFDIYAYFGQNNTYTITVNNNGNMTQSGSITVSFDDTISNFVAADPAIDGSSQDLLEWTFTDLQPFESRDIDLVFYVHGLTDSPPLNDGDFIAYTATILTSEIDDTPADNTTILDQMVTYDVLSTEAFELSDYFKLYPNPANDFVNIQIQPGIEILGTEIYNTRGQLVTTVKDRLTTAVDIAAWPSGIYFVIIQTDRGVYKTRFIRR